MKALLLFIKHFFLCSIYGHEIGYRIINEDNVEDVDADYPEHYCKKCGTSLEPPEWYYIENDHPKRFTRLWWQMHKDLLEAKIRRFIKFRFLELRYLKNTFRHFSFDKPQIGTRYNDKTGEDYNVGIEFCFGYKKNPIVIRLHYKRDKLFQFVIYVAIVSDFLGRNNYKYCGNHFSFINWSFSFRPSDIILYWKNRIRSIRNKIHNKRAVRINARYLRRRYNA